jgi:hypothetical protein
MRSKKLPTDLPSARREVRALRKDLADLVRSVSTCLVLIDKEMGTESSPERGRRIATILNAMEMANDRARFFGLGIDHRGDGARKDEYRKTVLADTEQAIDAMREGGSR